MVTRPDPAEAGARYVSATLPQAQAAFVGGSVVRGEGTATSDLDVVIILDGPPAPYRETAVRDGWIMETFVHTAESLRAWVARDVAERKPVLAHILAEGLVVVDRGPARELKAEMSALVAAGPPPLTPAERDDFRYGISDRLDDLADSPPGLERLMATQLVVEGLIRLELAAAGRWSGHGKWIVRRLAEHQPARARELEAASAAAVDDPTELIELADRWLAPHGGRLIDGYRVDGGPALAEMLAVRDRRRQR